MRWVSIASRRALDTEGVQGVYAASPIELSNIARLRTSVPISMIWITPAFLELGEFVW